MKKMGLRILIIVASIVMIQIGTQKGQNQAVLYKAIQICLECVGIG